MKRKIPLIDSWKKYGTRRLAMRAVRGLCSPLILKMTANRAYDPGQTIVICGSPRSGTTWLAETLNSIPRSAILFEPEHVGEVQEARAAGLKWHTYKDRGELWPEGERFFRQVLSGKVLSAWTTSLVPLHRAFRPERWIVKLVDANFFLGWLATTIRSRRPILLLRHPCAVVASQMDRGWGHTRAPRLERFFANFPELSGVLDGLTDPWEFTAAFWCMQTFAPLALPQPFPFHVVFYESLVFDLERTLQPVFDDWGLKLPESLATRAREISQTTGQNRKMSTPESGTSRWQQAMTRETRSKVLDVVRRFGLDFYNDDAVPDQLRFREFLSNRNNRNLLRLSEPTGSTVP